MMHKMEYQVIRSKRKTVALQVREDGIFVRAPLGMPMGKIEKFVIEHEAWIEKQWKKIAREQQNRSQTEKLSPEELRALAEQAAKVIPQRVRHYAPSVGVSYGRITIRKQRTRWGSCSSKGNLNFNCLLMLAPPEVLDAVVVHELCHRKEMNHSKAFYAEVYRVFPEYDKWNKWLKENGAALMSRRPG